MYAILSGFYFIFLRKVLYQTFSSLNQIQKNIIDFFIILFYSTYFFSGYVLDRNYLDDFISKNIFRLILLFLVLINQTLLGAGHFQPNTFAVFFIVAIFTF